MFPSTTALTVYSLDIPPFMSYAAAYSLYNYTLASPAHGMDYSNLRLIRAFEKGLDPTSSEAGFVLTHVDMVKESHALVRGAVTAIESTHDRETFNAGLGDIIAGMQKVESSMEVMWANSKPAEYLSFRTSSSASRRSLCSPMVSCTKGYGMMSRCSSVGSRGPTTL